MSDVLIDRPELNSLGQYEFGWSDSDVAGAAAKRGLSKEVVENISDLKNEPDSMRKLRLKGLDLFGKKPMPTWGADLSGIDFDNIKYFVRSTEKQAQTWDDLPDDIKSTYEKLGIPEAERQRLVSGVAAQYESEVVYHTINAELEAQGVIFMDTDTALREHPEFFDEYFATVIPPGDNKFAALNTAVWSGGSFVYVPKGVHVEIPLQAYFRINTENMGQFERTLIIADEGSYVHYIEGCTARSTRATRCTPPSSRSWSRRTPACATRPFRTGRTTSTTWSPSARSRTRARPWSGSTATSARRSP
jgi:Fe-S cluster assembly protein SufB